MDSFSNIRFLSTVITPNKEIWKKWQIRKFLEIPYLDQNLELHEKD